METWMLRWGPWAILIPIKATMVLKRKYVVILLPNDSMDKQSGKPKGRDGNNRDQCDQMARLFFNIWPFARSKNCHNGIKVGQIRLKSLLNTNYPSKRCPTLFKFRQRSGILPSLVTTESNLACFSSGGLVNPKNFLLQIVFVQWRSSRETIPKTWNMRRVEAVQSLSPPWLGKWYSLDQLRRWSSLSLLVYKLYNHV